MKGCISQSPRRAAAANRARLLVSGGSHDRLGANQLASDGRAYIAALEHQPRLADELEQLRRAIEDWQAPALPLPATPHRARMHDLAETIKACAAELFTAPHGPDMALRTSIPACRENTDLTGDTIAAIHHIKDVQPAFSQATVATRRHADCGFDRRYR